MSNKMQKVPVSNDACSRFFLVLSGSYLYRVVSNLSRSFNDILK